MNTALWIAQALLAASFLMGAVLKFMPAEKTAPKMPWMGDTPSTYVKLLGVLDIIAAIGIILPQWLGIAPQLTVYTATGMIVLMLSAIIFHIRRGEQKDIGFNVFVILLAAFVAWGRF